VTEAIEAGGAQQLQIYVNEILEPQMQQIVQLVRGKLDTYAATRRGHCCSSVTPHPSSIQRSTLGALVVIDVHARDTVRMMIDADVHKTSDFNWISQVPCDDFFFSYLFTHQLPPLCAQSSCGTPGRRAGRKGKQWTGATTHSSPILSTPAPCE
jgi:hypothetical protein